jgi:hypothetical protein
MTEPRKEMTDVDAASYAAIATVVAGVLLGFCIDCGRWWLIIPSALVRRFTRQEKSHGDARRLRDPGAARQKREALYAHALSLGPPA